LRGHYVSEIPSRLFSHLFKLEQLAFKHSDLVIDNSLVIDKEAFFGLANLISLDLSGNDIKHLDPVTFVHTPKLKELNLMYTSLNIDKEFFSHLTNLKKIRISSYRLS
ncbi:hypothetical protein M569_17575, partial [Genlisea aurea]